MEKIYIWGVGIEVGEEKRIQNKLFLVLLADVVYICSKSRDPSMGPWSQSWLLL